MKIGHCNTQKDVFIIAEIGNNHEGDFQTAVKMIKSAANSGADAVKFQTIRADKLIGHENLDRIERLKEFEFSYTQFEELAKIANNEGIVFLSTPFDEESALFLNDLVPLYKIASGDITHYPLIKTIVKTGKDILLSCGYSTEKEIEKTLGFISNEQKKNNINQKIALLHCLVSYPAPDDQVNLSSIPFLMKKFGLPTGYSDHTIGISAAIASVAIGGRIVEKHFTLDKNYSDFRDHQLSADPNDFSILTKTIKKINSMLGGYGKDIMPCEEETGIQVRRSIVSRENIEAGKTITNSDLLYLRPGNGISPSEADLIIGKKIKCDLKKGQFVTFEMVS